MKLLAYDTSRDVLTVALMENGSIITEINGSGGRHSNVLIPTIETILHKAGWKIEDIDVVALGLGPGSFTGLRVGIATAKIFGYVLKKKIVGVSNLEALALDAAKGRVAVRMDARRAQVYGAAYENKGGDLKTLLKPSLMSIEAFDKKTAGMTLVKGDETSLLAAAIARTAMPLAAKKKFTDPFDLEPLYLRAKDCHVTLPKK